MPSPPVIDLEKLLAPIREDQPSGDELSIADPTGPLQLTKDSWEEARKLVKEQSDKERNGGIDSQGKPWRDVPKPNWDIVIERATNLLTQNSKDFRVASWLTEALLRKYEAPGLRDGLQLCLGLCDKYWDSIHPTPNEEYGHGDTVVGFSGLVSEASFPALLQITLAKGRREKERDERRYSAAQYNSATFLESITNADERKSAVESGQIQMSDFLSLAEVTPKSFYDTLFEDLQISIDVLAKLGDFLRSNCRNDQYDEQTIPAVTPFREQVEKLQKLAAKLRGDDAAQAGEVEQGGDATVEGTGGVVSAAGGFTRQSAYQTIERVAQYFERTEPHSPVCFVLRQAIRWGKMPLPELLSELIEDQSVMTELRKRVGLPAAKSDQT